MHSFPNSRTDDIFDPATDIPDCLKKYLSVVEDPRDIYASVKENRTRRVQLLTRRFYNQILYGCKNPACHVPTCLSYRRRVATGPVRLHNEVTARALAVRCVERYAHRGRDIDRIPRREKSKKHSQHYEIEPSDGLCYSESVVPWYADATEYLKKKHAATRGESQPQAKSQEVVEKVHSRPGSNSHPLASSREESFLKLNETNTHRGAEAELILRTDQNTVSGTASSTPSPSSPPATQTRFDTSSLTQSLFGMPSILHAIELPSAIANSQLLNQQPTTSDRGGEVSSQNHCRNTVSPTSIPLTPPQSPLPGLGKAYSFSLMPTSVLVFLRDLLYLNQEIICGSSNSPKTDFIDQSIFYVLSSPSRLLASVRNWNAYQSSGCQQSSKLSCEELAEREHDTATEAVVLPDWNTVEAICEEVLRVNHDEEHKLQVLSHLQRLLRHAYIAPPWFEKSLDKTRGVYLQNNEVVNLAILSLNIIAFGVKSNAEIHYDIHYGEYPLDCALKCFSNDVSNDSTTIWTCQPTITQLIVNIADVFSYRCSLDFARPTKFRHSHTTSTSQETGVIHVLLQVLVECKTECGSVYRGRNKLFNRHAAFLLDMMRTVLLVRWDRSAVVDRNSPVAGALEVIKGLYRARHKLLLDRSEFLMAVISDSLDEIEMPFEWLEFRSTPEKLHVLQFPFLLPDTALVAYFRSVNLKIMKHSYDKAMGTCHVGNAQLLFSRWRVNNVHEVLQKTRPHMARYFVMTVRRNHILEDAIGQIWQREHQELVRPLKVRMGEEDGEVGLDYGGIQQELFRLIFNEAFNPDYGMFVADSKTRTTWFRPGSLEPLYKFEALGVLASLAIYNGITIPMNMPLAFYRLILGLKVKNTEHIEDGWPELARSFEQMLAWEDGDVGDVMCRTYEFSYEKYGKIVSVDMSKHKLSSKSGTSKGTKHPDTPIEHIDAATSSISPEAPLVTNANRHSFVKDYIAHLTSKSIEPQLQAFLKGIKTLLSPQALTIFPPETLKVLFEGHPTTQAIDVEAWKTTTTYEDYQASDNIVTEFWDVLKNDFSQEQLRKLLEFVTASDRIPIGGWKGITFIIQRNAAGDEWLPASSTCYGRLFLPEYSSRDILKQKLEKAIETSYGFGMV